MKTEFKIWLINYILAPFSWSRWTDITTFAFAGSYLLQGKVNKRTNAKKFRVTTISSATMTTARYLNGLPMDKLEECKLIDKQVKFNQ